MNLSSFGEEGGEKRKRQAAVWQAGGGFRERVGKPKVSGNACLDFWLVRNKSEKEGRDAFHARL